MPFFRLLKYSPLSFFVTIFAVALSLKLNAQESTFSDTSIVEVEIFPDDPIVAAMDSLWLDERIHWQNCEWDTLCLNKYNFPFGHIPKYSDEEIAERLEILNKKTPLDLEYNAYVKAYISVYTERKREITTRVLGLAQLYYPLFEEKLDKFNMPLELKHLAVVESALNASARSRVGATGLWQFMYTTGKVYGLEVDSYVDDRMDPYKSTIAACRYMMALYKMYGDWNLVLAAYNSGPGNVNKAIRRSGGHRDYWKIRDYLPRETRSYVPAFIAVNYVMNYAPEHNLYPSSPNITFAEVDTIKVCRRTSLDQIAYFTAMDKEELTLLNPSLKNNIIPEDPRCRTLYLPLDKVGLYLANEDSLLNFSPPSAPEPEVKEEVAHYTVKRGDVLGVIAQRQGVSLNDLKAWNNIRGNNIYPGQKLEIRKSSPTLASTEENEKAEKKKDEVSTAGTKSDKTEGAIPKYHTVQSGDTLWDIANKYPGISVNQLKEVNSDLDFNRLKPGQKIKIPS